MLKPDLLSDRECVHVSISTISGREYDIHIDASAGFEAFQTELAEVSGIARICQRVLLDTQLITDLNWQFVIQKVQKSKGRFYWSCPAEAFQRETSKLVGLLGAELSRIEAGMSPNDPSYQLPRQVRERKNTSSISLTLVVSLEPIFACLEDACRKLTRILPHFGEIYIACGKTEYLHYVENCCEGLRSLSRYAGADNETAIEIVYKLCNHYYADIRAAATRVLPEIVEHGNARAIDQLLRRLRDGGHPSYQGSRIKKTFSHPVKLAAIAALEKVAPVGDSEVVKALVSVITDPAELDFDVVIEAISALPKIAHKGDRTSIHVLIWALQEPRIARAALLALQALALAGDNDAIAAVFVWSVELVDLQELAWKAVRKISLPNDPATISLIEGCLASSSSRVRCSAAETMGVVAEKGNEQAVVALLRRGGDANGKVRQAVIMSLCRICKDDDARVRRLLKARSGDWNARVRDVVVDAIQHFFWMCD